ncbi:MAG: prolyl-tRNA synthetase associated domain-containing protein [Patescibacteria group bacterium]
MEDIYEILKGLGVVYKKYEHPPVYTCEEAEKHHKDPEAGRCKNLFLRNKKGDKHYLIVIRADKKVDIENLTQLLLEDKLGFASNERLMKYLNLTTGAVSPFGLINDINKEVLVVIDSGLLDYKKLTFHPNINTVSLVISTSDFKKFLDWCGNSYRFIKI